MHPLFILIVALTAISNAAIADQFLRDQEISFRANSIEDKVIESGGMLEMCDTFLESSGCVDDHEIEIHQMRIVAGNELTPVSPEGVHQDGYRFIAMVGINRYNITGGNLLVCKTDEGEPPIVDFPLDDGEMLMLDDRAMWHDATPIKQVSHEVQGWMDAFILTAR